MLLTYPLGWPGLVYFFVPMRRIHAGSTRHSAVPTSGRVEFFPMLSEQVRPPCPSKPIADCDLSHRQVIRSHSPKSQKNGNVEIEIDNSHEASNQRL